MSSSDLPTFGTAEAGGERSTAGIHYLQRGELDDQGLVIPRSEIESALETAFPPDAELPIWLRQIRSTTRTTAPQNESAYPTLDLIAGLHGQHLPIYFVIWGQSTAVRLYLGTIDPTQASAAAALFESQFPGSELWPATGGPAEDRGEDHRRFAEEIVGLRTFLDRSRHVGVMTGLPTVKATPGESQVDRLVRGMYGTDWVYLVLAAPTSESTITATRLELLREQMRLEQEEGLRAWREQAAQTVSTMYHELLGLQSHLLDACLYEGGWWTQTYLSAADEATYQRLKALVRATFAGDHARIDRIRVLDCAGAGRKAASFSPIQQQRPTDGALSLGAWRSHRYETLTSSALLSALIHLPRLEVPGYQIRDSALFDVASHLPPGTPGIAIGEILSRGRPTNTSYLVRPQDLNKHALVVGITGSGKTKTTFRILRELQLLGSPVRFLAVEPAKREYRELAQILPDGGPVRVFTIGEEHDAAAPFRLNPFEIRPGVSVTTHINLLKSVFNASFGMWPPLPQVLERALHEVYRDKGWNTITNRNDRAIEADDGWPESAHPTLTDLHHKIEALVPRLGYEAEIAGNIRTALLTRLNSLRVGAKGRMLDTPRSLPIEDLYSTSTVLELEAVGDDDDKAFIIGLILISVYEAYQSGRLPKSDSLQHLTVIEEAHRLLTNVPASQSAESESPRAKAVETFVNMLSEIRAYGEGFLIAEQIPTKLAPDVIKNTSLKIVHRLVANDDRAAVGGAMNLNESQLRQLVTLAPGQAVVHGGGRFGDDNAMLVAVPLVRKTAAPVLDVRAPWEEFARPPRRAGLYRSYPSCQQVCGPPTVRCVEARRTAEDLLVGAGVERAVLGTVAASRFRGEPDILEVFVELLAEPLRRIRTAGPIGGTDPDRTLCVVTHAIIRVLDERGAALGWSYEDLVALRTLVLPTVAAIVRGEATSLLHVSNVAEFCRRFRIASDLDEAPDRHCSRVCGEPATCLYRAALDPLLADPRLEADFMEAGADPAAVLAASERAARLVVGQVGSPSQSDRREVRRAATCFAMHKTGADPTLWPSRHRDRLLDEILALDIEQPGGS